MHKNIPFFVRQGTIDNDVINQVVDDDIYYIEKIALNTNEPIIVDVGGHIGSYTKYASSKWPEGEFFVYEALPSNWPILEKNLNELNNIRIYKGACVGKPPINKRMIIQKNEEWVTGGWGLMFVDVEYELPEYEIAQTVDSFYSLSDLIKEIGHIDILKLDCEGSEFDIVEHLSDEELSKIDYIVAEVHTISTLHTHMKYPEFREKILKTFDCPELQARAVTDFSATFQILAKNKRLI